MPLQECQINGKSGWKWGQEGKCYTGENAKEEALRQGHAIEISKAKKDENYKRTLDKLSRGNSYE